LANAVGSYVARNELHRVVDSHTSADATPGAVDVQMNVSLWVIGLKEEHLSNESVGDLVVDLRAQEDDSIFEQSAIDVVDAFLAPRLFNYVWD
jgi:hypothetical protein